MPFYRKSAVLAGVLAGFAVLSSFPARASVLFERSVRDYYASGPVTLQGGQRASACTTNLDESPISILIGLLTADTGSLLASEHITLQPGTGVCISYHMPVSQGDNQIAPKNVVGVVVPNGFLQQNGEIVQDRPGGGCITASVQIQTFTPNLTLGQTLLYVPFLQHHSSGNNGD
ncbi:MAG: hypothetical protein NVSMB62_09210 [Acidobacteriaceae bacterium]